MSEIDILPYEEETVQILPVSIEQVVALSTNEEYISTLPVSDAGDVIYWTGSGLSSTAPSGVGSNVWQVGVAKNATDLHVEVRQVKNNA